MQTTSLAAIGENADMLISDASEGSEFALPGKIGAEAKRSDGGPCGFVEIEERFWTPSEVRRLREGSQSLVA